MIAQPCFMLCEEAWGSAKHMGTVHIHEAIHVMSSESENKERMRFWRSVVVVCLVVAVPMLWLTGVLRPPRPLFHSFYATPFNSERLPHWVAYGPVMDLSGNLCYFDLHMNLVLLDLALGRPERLVFSNDPALRPPQGEQWLKVPHVKVSVPKNPRDLLIVTGDYSVTTGNHRVIALANLQQGDAALMKAWWDEMRPDAVQALIDDDRIPQSIRTALDELGEDAGATGSDK
jgi:hypothetical protein